MCIRPIIVNGRSVPCGRCAECLKKVQNSWYIRCVEESKKYDDSLPICFCTLTYSEDNVPSVFTPDYLPNPLDCLSSCELDLCKSVVKLSNGDLAFKSYDYCRSVLDDSAFDNIPYSFKRSLRYRDVQSVLKHFRKWFVREHGFSTRVVRSDGSSYYRYICDKRFSYLIVGEYGPRTHRPHYHCLFFGLSESDFRRFCRFWSERFGFVGTISPKTKRENCFLYKNSDNVYKVSRYVSKYCSKIDSVLSYNERVGLVERSHKLVSNGFGWSEDFRNRFDIPSLDTSVSVFNQPFRPFPLRSKLVSILDSLVYSIKGFQYSLPRFFINRLFFRKNVKGNFQASPLWITLQDFKGLRSYEVRISQLGFVPLVNRPTYVPLSFRCLASASLYADTMVRFKNRNDVESSFVQQYKTSYF